MNWFKIINSADASQPVEIQIYQQIGKDWWSDSGVDAVGFADQLKAIPKGRKINVRINSPGGNVWDGLTIYNLLRDRKQDVTCYIDGVAASIASIIALAGEKVVMPKNAMMMIHDPSGMCAGTAEDMRKMAECLDRHKDSLVSIYVDETGQSEAKIREKMSAETWFTGQDALDFGLCTDLSEEVQIAASAHDFSRFRNVPDSLRDRPSNQKTTDPITMKKNILLDPQAGENNGGGGSASPKNKADESKSQTPKTETETVSASALEEIRKINARLETERTNRITKTIDNHIAEGRLTNSMRKFWIDSAVKDEAVLEQIQAMPVVNALPSPVRPLVEITAESPQDICKEMDRLRAPQDAFRKGNLDVDAVKASAIAAAEFHEKNRDTILRRVMNANTIGTGNKRQVILQETLRPFARRILPLRAFSTVWGSIKLQGLNTVEIPYFPLVSTASTDFVAANGYVMGDSTQNTKTSTVNKRKYQPIRFDSSELARQPALNLLKIAEAKGEKLAADVFADVMSVVTIANYGTAAYGAAASGFGIDDMATLKGVADVADWPEAGRSLFLNSAFDVNLFKDTGVISALNFGASDPVQRGKINSIFGFDYYMCNYIPANGETLGGFMAYMSAILFAGSPISPASEVLAQLSAYEVVIDPQTGASFEYRLWGNPDMDERRQVIECNYGYAAGELTALKRISTTAN